jgi:hypothetical protein
MIAQIPELTALINKIKVHMKSGCANFNVLVKLVAARADAEERFGQALKAACPDPPDKSDLLVAEFCEDMRVEGELHLKLAVELRTNVVTVLKNYSTTLTDRQKKLLGELKKSSEPFMKAADEVEKAKKAAEEANAKLAQTPGKKDLEKRAQKAREELTAKSERVDSLAAQFSNSQLPAIQTEFTDFDGSRLSTMQGAIRQIGRTRVAFAKALGQSSGGLIEKMEAFDGKGRSTRFVNRMFAGKDADEGDIDNAIAIALGDYRSDEPSDLQFHKGERIKLSSRHPSGWWIGEIGGRKGFLPKSFVSIPEEEQAGSIEYDETFVTLIEFHSPAAGFIELFPGDIVVVTSELNGVCAGKNLRTDKVGKFPLNAIDPGVN